MIEIFGKLEKLETQLLYPAIKISSKSVHNFSCNLNSKNLKGLSWLYGWDRVLTLVMQCHGHQNA